MLVDCGKGIERDVDLTKFGIDEAGLQPVAAHIIRVGVHNLLQDSQAGAKGEAAQAKVDAKLAALYSGEVRISSGPRGPKADPLSPALVGMATAIVQAQHVAELAKMSAKRRRQVLQERVRAYIQENRAELRRKVELFLAPEPPVPENKPAPTKKRAA